MPSSKVVKAANWEVVNAVRVAEIAGHTPLLNKGNQVEVKAKEARARVKARVPKETAITAVSPGTVSIGAPSPEVEKVVRV